MAAALRGAPHLARAQVQDCIDAASRNARDPPFGAGSRRRLHNPLHPAWVSDGGRVYQCGFKTTLVH